METTNNSKCKNCVPQEKVIRGVHLAMAYVPFQKYCSTYTPMESLIFGTTFPELNMPYKKNHTYCEPHDNCPHAKKH